MRNLSIHIGLCDRLNPGFGYQVNVEDAITGTTIRHTSIDPDTGVDLDLLGAIHVAHREAIVAHANVEHMTQEDVDAWLFRYARGRCDLLAYESARLGDRSDAAHMDELVRLFVGVAGGPR